MSGTYGRCQTPEKSGLPLGSRGAGPVGADVGTGVWAFVCACDGTREPAAMISPATAHAAAIVRCLRMKQLQWSVFGRRRHPRLDVAFAEILVVFFARILDELALLSREDAFVLPRFRVDHRVVHGHR